MVRELIATGKLRFGPEVSLWSLLRRPADLLDPENYMVGSELNDLTYDPERRRRQRPRDVATQNWLKRVAQLPRDQRDRVQAVRRLWADPRVLAFLDTISMAENARYNSSVGDNRPGMRTFDNFAWHPGFAGAKVGARTMSASGRYQIQGGLPDQEYSIRSKTLGLVDFSPLTQDAMATEILNRKGVVDALQVNDLERASRIADGIWVSFPGGSQSRTSQQEIEAEFHRRRLEHEERFRRRSPGQLR